MSNRALILACALLLAAGGCSREEVGAYKQAFDKSIEASAANSDRESCVATATRAGAEQLRAERYCTCLVAQLDKLTIDEKAALRPGSEKAVQASRYCLNNPF